MAVKELWYRQDMNKPVQVRQLAGAVFTEDNNGDLIGVECYDGDQPYNLSGSAVGYVIKEDGVTESINGTVSANKASITLPSTALDVPGSVHIAIRVTDGTTKAVVLALRAIVYRSRSEIVDSGGQTIYGIDDLLAQIATMEAGTEAANEAATAANTAATAANTAATAATEKAGLADTAATTANAAALKIDGMTASATALSTGDPATATVSDVDGHKHIAFGMPRGLTGLTPALSMGTVTTLNPDQSASATITGTAESPVLNLSIPRGQTGSVTNVYGSTIPYSESDSRTIKAVVDTKLESVPVMTGTTSSADGTAGLVPAPTTNKSGFYYLKSDGTWDNSMQSLLAATITSFQNMILTPNSPIPIPDVGDSVTYSMAGITEYHILLLWRFSTSHENVPPTDLEWGTATGTFTITNNGVATNETICPVFVSPTYKTATEEGSGD